jgi:transposase-like protein
LKLKRKRSEARPPKETVVLVCPVCGCDEIDYEAGMITGQKYKCKRCRYVGSFALERRVTVTDDDRIEEH